MYTPATPSFVKKNGYKGVYITRIYSRDVKYTCLTKRFARKKSDRVETRTEVARVAVKCINHQAMEFVQGILYLKRTHCQF